MLEARCGDRAAIAVTQLEASSVERCLLAAPGSVPTFSVAIARVDKIRFYAGSSPFYYSLSGQHHCCTLNLHFSRHEKDAMSTRLHDVLTRRASSH